MTKLNYLFRLFIFLSLSLILRLNYVSSQVILPWTEIGPQPSYDSDFDFTTRLSGRIQCIVPDPVDTNIIYVGLMDGGIWKTTNDGISWFPLLDSIYVEGTNTITIDPINHDIIYASWNGVDGGTFKSINGGLTWQSFFNTPGEILIDQFNPANMYSSGYLSRDTGSTWIQTGVPGYLLFDPKDHTILYKLENYIYPARVYKSIDSGATWDLISNLPLYGAKYAVSQTTPLIFYAIGNEHELYKSNDSCKSWIDITPSGFFAYFSGYNSAIAINPKNSDIIWAGGIRLNKSTDGGNTWSMVDYSGGKNVIHYDHRSIVYSNLIDNKCYLGNDGGIYTAIDTQLTYRDLNGNLGTILAYGLGVSNSKPYRYLIGTQDNGMFYVRDGAGYQVHGDGDSYEGTLFHPSSEKIIFESSLLGSSVLRRFETNTPDWPDQIAEFVVIAHDFDYPYPGPVYFHKRNPDRVYVQADYIYRATDGARTDSSFKSISPGLGGNAYTQIAIGGPDTLETIYSVNGIMTTDGGMNWSSFTPGESMTSIYTHPNSPNIVYAACYDTTIRRSSDYGATWEVLPTGVFIYTVRRMFVSPDDKIIIVLAARGIGTGERGEIYYFHRDSLVWQELGGLLDGARQITDMDWRANGDLIISTFGRGVWQTNFYPSSATPPQIIWYSPPDTELVVDFGDTISFVVSAIDSQEQQLGIAWYNNGERMNNTGKYYFTQGENNYKIIKVDISNADTSISVQWVLRPPLPASPNLLSPPDRSMSVPTTATLKWNYSQNVVGYTIFVSSDSMFSDTVFYQEGIRFLYKIIPNLLNSTSYSWKVRGSNISGNSDWSNPWMFTTAPLSYAGVFPVSNRWNLISLPFKVDDPRVSLTFPSASSQAYAFSGSYFLAESLNTGYGYWIKFDSAENISISGLLLESESVPVEIGWNLIGSISTSITVSTITSIPPSMITSNFYGYHGSYVAADTIYPSKGYWVKTSGSGVLHLSQSIMIPMAGRITIIPTNDSPPPHPGGEIELYPDIPTFYSVQQNYPNPFNPATTIQFTLPKEVYVRIQVFNVLGQVVVTLMEGEQGPGYKSVQWDASKLPSGVYYYRLTAGSFTETKKMLLIR